MKKNIAIVMGGYSSEVDISLKSGNVVYNHLDKNLYNPFRVHILKEKWVVVDDNDNEYPVDKNDFSLILNNEKIIFDLAFLMIHGHPAEDGHLQGYLEII